MTMFNLAFLFKVELLLSFKCELLIVDLFNVQRLGSSSCLSQTAQSSQKKKKLIKLGKKCGIFVERDLSFVKQL